ncbi:MAG: sigma-70 family RNA polymerase sigma factor [Polyangiales bacterium]
MARRWRDSGDTKAAEKLIRANLKYVVAIAISYRRYGLRLGDLVSEGNLGLMMALRKFDPDRGVRFVTYAAYWSRAYILNFVIKSWSLVGGGSGPLRSKMFFKLRRERAMVANVIGEGNEEQAMTMLAERIGETVERTKELTRRLEARDVSLDVPAHEEGRVSLLDGLQDGSANQEDRFMAAERRDALKGALSGAVASLDDRERFIVEQRLMAEEETSLAEIGRQLGVSRERARQLEARAKAKLKKQLSELASVLDLGLGEGVAA